MGKSILSKWKRLDLPRWRAQSERTICFSQNSAELAAIKYEATFHSFGFFVRKL